MTELPALLEEIAEVAGWDAAWALVDAKGGQEIFVPRSASAQHWLSLLVGAEAANRLCAYYRSNHTSRLLIPMAAALQRDRRFLAAIEANQSANETARALGVHKRTVFRHRARLKGPQQNDRQGKLF